MLDPVAAIRENFTISHNVVLQTFSMFIRQSQCIEFWTIGEMYRIVNECFTYCFPATDYDHIPAQFAYSTVNTGKQL